MMEKEKKCFLEFIPIIIMFAFWITIWVLSWIASSMDRDEMNKIIESLPECSDVGVFNKYKACLLENSLGREMCWKLIAKTEECNCKNCDSSFKDKKREMEK